MDKNLKTALIIGGIVLVVLPLVFGLISGSQGGGMMGSGMMGSGMMGGFGGMGLMSLVWIIVLGLIIWAVVAAVRRPRESNGTPRSANSALEILKRSYARGEISKDEFESKKKDWGSDMKKTKALSGPLLLQSQIPKGVLQY